MCAHTVLTHPALLCTCLLAFRSYFFTMETGGIDTAAMDDENEARLTSSGVE